MPKPDLIPEQVLLECQMIETMHAGLHNWRPELDYPASYSDMQACARGLMAMFEIKRRPLPTRLLSPCNACGGTGYFRQDEHHSTICPKCTDGKIKVDP